MTERLRDVEARIGTVHQLSAVITAMRSIAAARTREARAHLDGIRAYATTIGAAIGEGLAVLPEDARSRLDTPITGTHAIVALTAEQGFAGAFSEHILDAAARLAAADPPGATDLMLVGDRGLMLATERDLSIDWSAPMVVHAGQAASLADRIVEALYSRLDADAVVRVTVVHADPEASDPSAVMEKRLVPFDFSRFPVAETAETPLMTLEPQHLLARLAEEYVFAEMCEAVMLSFAAENAARMRAMIAAKENVEDTMGKLVARARQVRQDEITAEIIELASGAR
ncbi:F0F1 ATP synthase subunit gamma [Amorphus sp. 3PC139-8]|uniref:F0F1 ATP synthase subunit gamma n=1 Tax=Amorphus sp. 3PC139-8 TaxID=2735676 RepID=UPI00345CCD81